MEADSGAHRLDREAPLDPVLLRPFARRLHHAMRVTAAREIPIGDRKTIAPRRALRP
jgi:hypothetical protein